jgi:aromatic-L-amino-acid decarboxylase
MTPDEFRQQAYAVVDWIADYMRRADELPVGPQVAPGDVRALLPDAAPAEGEQWDAIIADLDRVVVPAMTRWQHPGWFAYFPANASGPSVLGELVSAALGEQGMLWATSPVCTELETHVLDWMVDALALPPAFRSDAAGGGVIQDSASSAAICALVAARERAGADGGELVAYASTQAHSSIEKGARVIGIRHIRAVDVDAAQAMRPEALQAAIDEDRAAGRRPFFVAATQGSTSSLAFDPLPALGAISARERLWLHVDGAMAGVAALCPELRWVNQGLELATSYCTNPHKWLLTNFDCTLFWVADRRLLIGALSVLPEYLRNAASESGAVIDYRDWQLPLGRRFRALKLWFVLRHYGIAGLQRHLRRGVEITAELVRWIEDDDRFEIAVPPVLNLVCFRLRDGDDADNEALLKAVNATGEAYLSHTKLDGRYALRLCVGQTATERRHVERAWALLRAHAPSVVG